jgi:hypothetical protein
MEISLAPVQIPDREGTLFFNKMDITYLTELFRNNFRAILNLNSIVTASGLEFGLTRFIPKIMLANLNRDSERIPHSHALGVTGLASELQ